MQALSENFGPLQAFVESHPTLFILLVAWSLAWKGVALWRSAQLNQRWWFVVMLVLNTAGLLEIGYLLFVARRYEVEVVET